ncbi:MAG: alpha/beta fold hydrolase [Proteobacteria bacterium]|nr:alpha/beta fold hydrolase [Pseudomonadota bacterium]
MSRVASPFRPARGLRNPHLQTFLGSGFRRSRLARRELARCDAVHEEVTLAAGGDARLQGIYSRPRLQRSDTLVLLLHGWEGSIESNYMRLSAALLLDAGFTVLRLNFRDHGNTHHLNEEMFHSGRIEDVLNAAKDALVRWQPARLVVAGFSLGGNFALRTALHARSAGLPLVQALAVCPPLDPARTMDAMEAGWWPYIRHFEREWRQSLRRKRELFPQRHGFADAVLKLPMRALTAWMVEAHTDYGTLDAYFDAYHVDVAALGASCVPVDVLMSADDPVVPLVDFGGLAEQANARVELSANGGHCGFIENWAMRGYGERWIAERIIANERGLGQTAGDDEGDSP